MREFDARAASVTAIDTPTAVASATSAPSATGTPVPAPTETPEPAPTTRAPIRTGLAPGFSPAPDSDPMFLTGSIFVDARPYYGEVVASINGVECGRGQAGRVQSEPPSDSSTYIIQIASSATKPGCGTPGAIMTFTAAGRVMNDTVEWAPGYRHLITLIAGPLWATFYGQVLVAGNPEGVKLLAFIDGVLCGEAPVERVLYPSDIHYAVVVDPAELRPGCGRDEVPVTLLFRAEGYPDVALDTLPWRTGTVELPAVDLNGAIPVTFLPMFLNGTVWVEARPSLGEVVAFINGVECGRTWPVAASGRHLAEFYLPVKSDDGVNGCGSAGESVTITVDGRAVNRTFVWQEGFTDPVGLVVGPDFALLSGEILVRGDPPPFRVVAYIDGQVCGEDTVTRLNGYAKLLYDVVVPPQELRPGCGRDGVAVTLAVQVEGQPDIVLETLPWQAVANDRPTVDLNGRVPVAPTATAGAP